MRKIEGENDGKAGQEKDGDGEREIKRKRGESGRP